MLRNYLKIALRSLVKNKVYSVINIGGLALGLACGLLIFLFVKHHLSTDRHHANYERIYRINTDLHLDDGTIEYNPDAPRPMVKVLREEFPQVEQAGFLMMNKELTVGVQQSGRKDPARFLEKNHTAFVEPEWFNILTYEWLQGNPQTALGQPNNVVLTESLAKKYFGNANPIGQILRLDNQTNAIVSGLLAEPPATTDTKIDLFISIATLTNLDYGHDPTNWYELNSTKRLYVLLKEGQSAAAVQRGFAALSKKHYGDNAHIFHFNIQPMRELHFDVLRGGGAVRSSLLWALGIIGLLLLGAACINFVNLATAQAFGRSKEVGVRKTLGSSRGQLMGQFLLETTLLILAAAALATLLFGWWLPLFNNWTQLNLSVSFDAPTLLFVALLLSIVVVVAGLYPAILVSGFSPWAALRNQIAAPSNRGFSLQKTLVIAQFAVCNALIIGALVVISQLRYIQNADLGFKKNNVVMVKLPYGMSANHQSFKQQVLQLNNVSSVSLSHRPPTSELQFGGSFKFNNRPNWEPYPTRDRLTDADFLKTYGLQLVAGRNIAKSDTVQEYLINETLARRLGYKNPAQILGKTLQYHLSPVSLPIVGVVKDFHQKSLREAIEPCIIASKSDRYELSGIHISAGSPANLVGNVEEIWQKLFPNEVFQYQYLDEQLASFYETETLITRLVNVFTAITIFICCMGLYGLVSQVVVRRTKEIGIRKVLGASVVSITTLLSKDFLKLVLIALVVASPVAYYLMDKWLADFAYRINIEWWIFALAGVLAVSVALLTVSYQAIRAALMNPVESLKTE